ncbi:hypothetical protein QJS04_geneDACA013086 [Acorus gramineus]|uniref:Protein RTE1-HOMOLOG n=1 Tax=Acorus gramineus TaxID=55184 RepID=A0AAV9B7U0_ACOGR|nr:hypothetical protein QJS04_geneDACA013086 [Acorus gramineus]
MDLEATADSVPMLRKMFLLGPIDPKRARFPCCLVWTPLPIISWFIPFIGHIGICREDGVILDFAGPNFVCVDHFAFGAVARYLQIDRAKCCCSPGFSGSENQPEEVMTYDDALRKGTQEFQHRSYSLFTCNCHSFVANNLNRLVYGGHDRWNVVNLAAMIFFRGKWVSKASIAKSFLPFFVVFLLGLFLGGQTFLIVWAVFTLSLIGWFLIGTYCFRSLIQL